MERRVAGRRCRNTVGRAGPGRAGPGGGAQHSVSVAGAGRARRPRAERRVGGRDRLSHGCPGPPPPPPLVGCGAAVRAQAILITSLITYLITSQITSQITYLITSLVTSAV